MPPPNKPIWIKVFTKRQKAAYYGRLYLHSMLTRNRGDWCCWPELPNRRTLAWKIARLSGLRLVNQPTTRTTIAMLNDLDTHVRGARPDGLPEGVRILNERCTDISKEHIEAVHKEVFGYGMAVDPTTHVGPMVAKSDANAKHDGRVIEGPITDPDPSSVYQIVIDNTVTSIDGKPVAEPTVLDLRITIVGDAVTGVFLKYRPELTRFLNRNQHVSWQPTDQVFSEQEQHTLVAFASELGLDLGEIDVLRDNGDGRIYAIDANKTPYSPPSWLEHPVAAWPSMARAAAAFQRQWLSGTR